jgi:hypothetical protein
MLGGYMSINHKIELWEDEIIRDENENIIHHPVNSRYGYIREGQHHSYGYLTFAGHNLDKSLRIDDIHFYYLKFFDGSSILDDRESWADPLRLEVIKSLTNNERAWYLSIIDELPIDVSKQTEFTKSKPLEYVTVQSEKHFGYGYGFLPRLFVEVPNEILPIVVNTYWSNAVPGWPIEGYNMQNNQIDLLREWNQRPRDDHLFREVIDKTFISFYTYPEENRHFVFVTNKLDFEDFKKIIKIDELKQIALSL